MLQLFTGGTATNTKGEDAAERIADIVHGKVQVGASPAVKQFASVVTSIGPSSAAPVETREAVRPKDALTSAAATTAADEYNGLPDFGSSFEGMNTALYHYQVSLPTFQRMLAEIPSNTELYLSKGYTTDDIARLKSRYEDDIAVMQAGARQLDQIASKWLAGLTSSFTVTGTVFTQSQTGTIEWGTFEARNRYTGEFAFGHDGSGVEKISDPVNRNVFDLDLYQ